MRQGTYLNVILTVNAALLTGILWGQCASHAVFSSQAAAQSSGTTGAPSLIPINAADQRQKQIEELRDVKGSIDALKKSIESGKVKVEVTNFDQLKTAMEKK